MSTTGTGTHFKARINQSGHDDTNVLREGAVPIVGATAIGALSLGGVTAALIPAVVAGGLMAVDGLFNTDMSSGGWYAGKRHELEICGGGNQRFSIYNTRTKITYNL